MPFSSPSGKLYTYQMLNQLNAAGLLDRIVDVGAGIGTYHKLVAEDLSRKAEWIALEVWEPYIKEFELESLYDRLINIDVRKFDFSEVPNTNLALFGDILEHMTKEEAIATTDACLKHCDAFMISIPILHAPQGEEYGNPYEVHVKDDWSHEEVLETFPNTVCHFVEGEIGVYFITTNEKVSAFLKELHPQVVAVCKDLDPNAVAMGATSPS